MISTSVVGLQFVLQDQDYKNQPKSQALACCKDLLSTQQEIPQQPSG